MTYKEAYLKCNTLEELENLVRTDLDIAHYFWSADRCIEIHKAEQEVMDEKWGNEKEG